MKKMAREKEHINLIFIGHVDHGKSTTVGRILYDTKNVNEQTMRKLTERAKEVGKSGFEFAFVMDTLEEEQKKGVTIDLSHKKFDTDKYSFTVIDAPGHRDFIKNMITGTSQADAAVLVISGNKGEAEAGLKRPDDDGPGGQTYEHIFLARTLGVQQIIVAVNKMDMAKYDEARFKEVKDLTGQVLKGVGFDPEKVPFVPIASFPGINITKKPEEMSWYEGPTILDAINGLTSPEKPTELPLRLPIQDVYEIKGIGAVPVGRIETGVMKTNDKVIVVPAREGTGVTGEVKTIEMHHEVVAKAEPGDNVGFSVRGINKQDITRGDVLGHANSPPSVAKEFTARIVVLNHPNVMTVGYTPVFHIHTAQIACKISEIVKKINPATGETLQDKPDFLKNGDVAIVKIQPVGTAGLVIEKQEEIPQLARFAIRDSGQTVAAGQCIDLVKK
jgi:elongation factor 1-alpha